MPERIPVLKIPFIVEGHLTKEDKDKADQYVVTLKSPDMQFKVGAEDAKAQLKIKALDDVAKELLPLYGEFVCEVYGVMRGIPEQPRTKPTTLDRQSKEAQQ
jgi:hypothetical protein